MIICVDVNYVRRHWNTDCQEIGKQDVICHGTCLYHKCDNSVLFQLINMSNDVTELNDLLEKMFDQ